MTRAWRWLGTLRGRIVLGVALVHAVMMSVFIADLVSRERAALLDRQVDAATTQCETLAISAAEWLAADDIAGLQELVDSQRGHPELRYVLVTDEDGLVLAATDRSRLGQFVLDLPTDPHAAVMSRSAALVDVVVPAAVGERLVGWVRVGVGQEVTARRLAATTRSGVAYALVAIVVGAIAAWVVGGRTTRRLHALQRTAAAVRAGNRQARTAMRGHDEAADLAREFDTMLDTLSARDAALHQVNRELRAITACDQVLVRAEDEHELLADVCQIICADAGYRMAFVGLVEHDAARTIRPVAWAGVEDGYLAEAGLTWSEDDPRGRGPAGTTVRTGQTIEVRDVAGAEEVAPWRDAALARGYRSSIALALRDGEVVFGVLVIYAPAPGAFDADEVRLLEGLASDLAFGIVTLRARLAYARTQAALQASEAEYRTLFEESLDGLFVSTPDGRIADMNKRGIAILGYASKEEAQRLSLPRDVYTDPTERARVLRAVDAAGAAEVEVSLRRKGGERFVAQLHMATVRDAHGVVTSYRGILRDVTDRVRGEERQRQLQAELRQAQKMEAFGQLAGGVAHDFNNILTVIQGNASLLRETVGDADHATAADEVLAAVDRASRLTRQLLVFSRRQAVKLEDLDLNAVVMDTTLILQRLIGEHIALEASYAPGAPVVHADRGMVEQVLMNLAVNARDAMPPGGRLVLATGRHTCAADEAARHPGVEPGDYVRLSVTDTGQGIAPEHLPHIFEPFYTTKDVGRGTGLGLATVFGIVEQHHGWLDVETEVGVGTTFHVHLPCAAGRCAARAPRASATDERRGTEMILMVEDEPALRALARAVLTRQGYRVLEAATGGEAVALWGQHRDEVALLFTDMVMPGGMSGWELARRLQAERAGLPVLFTTGYTDEMLGDAASLRGADNLLEKPYDVVGMLRAVRRCLDAR